MRRPTTRHRLASRKKVRIKRVSTEGVGRRIEEILSRDWQIEPRRWLRSRWERPHERPSRRKNGGRGGRRGEANGWSTRTRLMNEKAWQAVSTPSRIGKSSALFRVKRRSSRIKVFIHGAQKSRHSLLISTAPIPIEKNSFLVMERRHRPFTRTLCYWRQLNVSGEESIISLMVYIKNSMSVNGWARAEICHQTPLAPGTW
jgi:hypothetical protein